MTLRWTIFVTACLPLMAGCGSSAQNADSSSVHKAENIILKSKLDAAKKLAAILDPQLIQSVRGYVQKQVAAGFDAPAQIVTTALELHSHLSNEEGLKLFVEKALKESLAEHLAAQQNWPTVTDC